MLFRSVVVDNARKMINKTVDVTVTSVLQTTAGKMIFSKYDERAQRPSTTAGPRPVDLPPPAEGDPAGNGTTRAARETPGPRETGPRREAPING